MLKRKLYRTVTIGTCLSFIAIVASPQLQLIDSTVNNDSIATQNAEQSTLSDAPIIELNKLNKRASSYVKKYLKEFDEELVLAKKRSGNYFPAMDAIFTKYELPVQLKYLAVIESNLKASAKSHVGAAGLWQLMPATAKIFGLKITNKYDERRQFYKSTVAAARYLKELYEEFDDWLLAIAAYNGGPARVHKAMRLAGSHDFWRLQNFLSAETRSYVKKFIGAHYYFEGKGSEATLTKGENIQYKKEVAEFMESNSLANENKVADTK